MRLLLPSVATSAVVILFASAAALATGPGPDRSTLWRSGEAFARVLPDEFLRSTGGASYGYDVDDVHLAIRILPASIIATTTLTVTVVDDVLTQMAVDLADALTVDSVRVDGVAAAFTHGGDQVLVTLAVPASVGTQLAVAVSYHGTPQPVSHKGFQFGSHDGAPIVFTLGVPYSESITRVSSTWRPCKDVPDDKSTLTMEITVPDTELACSNGVMTSDVDNGDGTRTVTWEHDFPIAPYLVTLASTNFVTIDDTYHGATDSAAVQHFVYPELLADATEGFDVVVPAMEHFASVFGEYPFLGEKFGMFTAPSPTSVESQTMVAYNDGLVDALHQYDWLVAHELAHQWWGDCVGAETWDHVWLNEGFASYAEAIWQEGVAGFGAYQWYMGMLDTGPWDGTIADPPSLWSSIVYDKGAWVLHMLRWVLGGAGFFQFLLDYRTAHEYTTATTDDLIAVAESVYGEDLSWFFDEWIQEPGRPDYTYGYAIGGTGPYTVHLEVRQVQSGAFPVYTMPLRVRVETVAGQQGFTVWDSLAVQSFDLALDDQPTGIVMDPRNWILGDFTEMPLDASPTVPRTPSRVSCAPNPFTTSTRIRYELRRPAPVSLRILDVRGRLVRTLVRGPVGAGAHRVTWDGRDGRGAPVVSGVYFYELAAPAGSLHGRVTRVR